MSRVFLVERPKANIDVTKAEEFGELNYVFGPDDRRCSVFRTTEFGHEVIARLETAKYDSTVDFFCIAGSMVTVAAALAAMMSRYSVVRVLMYSAPDNRYVKRTFDSSVWKGDGSDEARTESALPEGSRVS